MFQMTEEHGHEVASVRKAFRVVLHTVFTDKSAERIAGSALECLTEEVRRIFHEFASVSGLRCVLRKLILTSPEAGGIFFKVRCRPKTVFWTGLGSGRERDGTSAQSRLLIQNRELPDAKVGRELRLLDIILPLRWPKFSRGNKSIGMV